MKRLLFLSLFFLLFSSCKKEEVSYDVLYKVVVGSTSGYTVRYTLPDGTTASKGTLTDALWISQEYSGYKKGFPISLTLESGGGSYVLRIYIDGVLTAERNAGGGGSQTLETHTPY